MILDSSPIVRSKLTLFHEISDYFLQYHFKSESISNWRNHKSLCLRDTLSAPCSRSRWLENCPYVECQVGITSDKKEIGLQFHWGFAEHDNRLSVLAFPPPPFSRPSQFTHARVVRLPPPPND